MFSRQKNEFWFAAGFDTFSNLISKNGWECTRNEFNAQYPRDWRPADAEDWNYSKGGIEALYQNIPSQ